MNCLAYLSAVNILSQGSLHRRSNSTLHCEPKASCVPALRPMTEFHAMRRTLNPAPINTWAIAEGLYALLQVLFRAFEEEVQLRPCEHHRYRYMCCPILSPASRPDRARTVPFRHRYRVVEPLALLEYLCIHRAWTEHGTIFHGCGMQEVIGSMICLHGSENGKDW